MGLSIETIKTFAFENKIYIIAIVIVLCTIIIYYRYARGSSKMCDSPMEKRIDAHIKSIRAKQQQKEQRRRS